jgi:HEAT repeat protein
VIERLLGEGGRSLPDLLNVLPDDKRTADLVSGLYNDPATSEEERTRLKEWLLYNSSVFSDQLSARAQNVRDANDYVNAASENSLLALTRHDWDEARPVVERLYNDPAQPVSRALATWAFYRHAMESGDSAETDRYRSELMRMVEDRSLADGVRDMANDAIVREADFPGRDEWCWSLFEDETLVNMQRFTGLTTIIMYQPPDKYVPKMIEFLKSSNKTVRLMAARNLITAMGRSKNPEIIRALLPWLEDPKWIEIPDDSSPRIQMVMFLATTKMPESLPGLIAALDEKGTREMTYGPGANAMSNSANAIANTEMVVVTNTNSNRSRSTNSSAVRVETYYPLREYAVRALATQADSRAIPALRRLLTTATDYQRNEIIGALFNCGGFSVPEQVNALEAFARLIPAGDSTVVNFGAFSNSANSSPLYYAQMAMAEAASRMDSSGEGRTNINFVLGSMVATTTEPSELLARATIDRIEELSKRDPQTSQTLRRIIVGWKGLAVSSLLLRDLKNGNADSDDIVRLLTERKLLREKLIQDVSDARSGTPIAAAIASCILEDPADHEAIINGKNVEARTALYACARLVRAPLPLAKVVEDLSSTDQNLKAAAELYLESEDSLEARNTILSQFPNEAKVLGATTCFPGKDNKREVTPQLLGLFMSTSGRQAASYFAYEGGCSASDVLDSETPLRKEVREDENLLGLYAYQDNFVRIYKDKVVFSWQNDPARYHERNLRPAEFDALRQLLSAANISELKPFLACGQGCGEARELLMIGRQGGRRVFVRTDRQPVIFSELEKLLAEFRSEPGDLKYTLSKQVPGLEVLFANDDLEAQTVWKQGSDLRAVISNKAVLQKIEAEIEQMRQSIYSQDDEDIVEEPDKSSEPPYVRLERMRQRRQYEGYSWHQILSGKVGAQAAQPPGLDYIPNLDGLPVLATQESWKARSGGFEIRTDDSGVYRSADGKLTQILKGYYNSPVISPNGRWLVISKFEENEGPSLVRYDLVSKREYKVPFAGYGMLSPRCYIQASGKFLVTAGYEDYESDDADESTEQNDDPRSHRYYLLDAQTGVLTPAFGEIRPLAEQTFRPLQSTGKPNEFWAALSGQSGDETVVGLYDSRLFRFTPVLKIPKITFSSLEMWVDQPENKVYFVYKGHLLSVPLKQPTTTKP